jgi:hypothetical protein
MKNQQMIDDCSWALAEALMDVFADRLPATELQDAFVAVYVRSAAILELFEERRHGVLHDIGVSKN